MDPLAQPPLVSTEISEQVLVHIDFLLLCPPTPRFEGSRPPNTLLTQRITGWVDSSPPVGVTSNKFSLYLTPSPGFAIRFRMEGTLQGNTDCMGAYSIGNLRTSLTPSDTHTHTHRLLSLNVNFFKNIFISLLWLKSKRLKVKVLMYLKKGKLQFCMVLKQFWIIRVVDRIIN